MNFVDNPKNIPVAAVVPTLRKRKTDVRCKVDGIGIAVITLDQCLEFRFRVIQWIQYKNCIRSHVDWDKIYFGYDMFLLKHKNKFTFMDPEGNDLLVLTEVEFEEVRTKKEPFEHLEEPHAILFLVLHL